MKSTYSIILLALVLTLSEARAQPTGQTVNRATPDFGLIGYANVDSTVTGGAGGETATVTNGVQLNEYASSKKPFIIQVSGTI